MHTFSTIPSKKFSIFYSQLSKYLTEKTPRNNSPCLLLCYINSINRILELKILKSSCKKMQPELFFFWPGTKD